MNVFLVCVVSIVSSCSYLQGMNQLSTRNANHTNQNALMCDPTQNITIIFGNRQRIRLPYDQAKKFHFFKSALLCTAPKNKHNVIKFPKSAHRFITKKNLELLLKPQLPPLSYDEFDGMYKLAHFLCAKDKVLYPLAESYAKNYCYRYISNEYCDLKGVLGIKHYFKLSVEKKRDRPWWICGSNLSLSFLDEIYSLHDIDYLTEQPGLKTIEERREIKSLTITYNHIHNFNIKKILKIFPRLRLLNLSNNAIRELDLENLSNMPDYFTLDLTNNPITSVVSQPSDRYPKNCIIRVSSTRDKKNIEQLKKIVSTLNKNSIYTRYNKCFVIADLASIAMLFSHCYFSMPWMQNSTLRYFVWFACLTPFILDTYFFYHHKKAQRYDNKIVLQ